jgi:hypothetical protein
LIMIAPVHNLSLEWAQTKILSKKEKKDKERRKSKRRME